MHINFGFYTELTGGDFVRACAKIRAVNRKELGPSEYSNSIFERFIGVFGLVFSTNHFF